MATLVEAGKDISGPTAARPSSAEPGQRFFDTTTGIMYGWNGSAWQPFSGIGTGEVLFTETDAAGTYTGTVPVPAGATIHDIIINGIALWTAASTATLKVGDAGNDAGFYTGVNLKATDLLAGESISFALAGGKAGAYIANSQVSPRYSASARSIIGVVTTTGANGNAGRTRMVVVFSLNKAVDATKV